MRYTFALILSFLLIVVPVTAQESASECDLTALVEAMGIASDTITVGDMDATLNALSDLENLIARTRAECTGLAFSSEADGQSPVLGPITLEAGIWISTVETDGYLIADATIIEGTCEWGFGGLYNLMQGQAVGGAQQVIQSEGCTILVEISNTRDPWTLTFESVQ